MQTVLCMAMKSTWFVFHVNNSILYCDIKMSLFEAVLYWK